MAGIICTKWGKIMEDLEIQSICKEKKAALGLTQQEIADRTGIPSATIKNFFSKASKAPSIYTVGPICETLGISLDAYFGITDRLTPTEKTLSAENDVLQAHRDGLEQQVKNKDRTIDLLWRGVRARNRVISCMLIVIIILLLWSIHLDAHCLEAGFWQG